jgi:MraZ protein
VVIGAVDYLEIWDAQAWQNYQQTHEENFSAASDEALGDII